MAYSVHNITARATWCATADRAGRAIGTATWWRRTKPTTAAPASGGRVIRFQRWDGEW